jgi:hypothetical protein
MKTSLRITTFVVLAVLNTGCRDPLPCSDCEAADDPEPSEDLPGDTPDLPCGGTDLSSDSNNCGECGNVCYVNSNALGTSSEAGGCVDGTCAPTWGSCEPHYEDMPRTCAEFCTYSSGTCQANACAGHTAIFFTTNPFNPACWEGNPFADFDGGCDDPLTAPEDDEGAGIYVQCCCSYE